jgi:hypothetical protein
MNPQEHIERTLLGACLDEDEQTLKLVSARLLPAHFSLDSHKRIARRIISLYRKQQPVNSVTILQEIMHHHELETVGGAAYLHDLTADLPRGLGKSAQNYIERLEEFWRLNQLRELSAKIETEINEAGSDSAAIAQQISVQVEKLFASVGHGKSRFFADFPEFATEEAKEIDWMLAGIIERGANGFIAAEPKGAKSFCSADLVLALATGSSWLEFAVPRPTRVGLVSREDNPSLTRWRLKALMAGRSFSPVQLNYLEQNLYVNTRAQTSSLMLDNEREMDELIGAVKERKIEFVLLDVFNVLHSADENDNTQMAAVLRRVRRIQDRTGAAIGIIHHYSKAEGQGRITQRLRGASAIAGFAEWIIGLRLVNEDGQIRQMEFELKAGASPAPINFCIDSSDNKLKLRRVTLQQSSANRKTAQKGVN